MGRQLIFCVETTSKCAADFMYIHSAIKQFYSIGSDIKLSVVYMGGKGNYKSGKIEKSIRKLEKEYRSTSSNNSSVVLLCFDCDEYTSNPEDAAFLKKAEEYSCEKQYRFVWFCKDIEHVFLGKRIPDNTKKKEAERFIQHCSIRETHIESLKATHFQERKSNLCAVLDEYLPRAK